MEAKNYRFNKRVRFVSVAEMNEHLEYCAMYRNIIYGEKSRLEFCGMNAYIIIRITTMELTYKIGDFICTYVTHLDTDDFETQQVKGAEAYRIMCHYHKFPKLSYMENVGFSASPIVMYNPLYEKQWLQGYYYDINSAYAAIMCAGIFPDTEQPPKTGIVGYNEIGFTFDGKKAIMVHEGFAQWIFPLVEIPEMKRFAKHWFDIKQKDPTRKNKAKNVLNFCIGYLQNINPFIRAWIVLSCNEKMEMIRKRYPNDWLLCNTDAIIARVPLDLPVGDDIGMFKFQKGRCAYSGNNYQFGRTLKYRGVPKAWFPRGWDITKDTLPPCNNMYEFDRDNVTIRKVRKK